jgi:hypothetical protein
VSVGQGRVWKKPGPNVRLSLCGERECVYGVVEYVYVRALLCMCLIAWKKPGPNVCLSLCGERECFFFPLLVDIVSLACCGINLICSSPHVQHTCILKKRLHTYV